jgi:DMSO/TMAO reductase YedYZ molybdopterin-dependent catalytic subunit
MGSMAKTSLYFGAVVFGLLTIAHVHHAQAQEQHPPPGGATLNIGGEVERPRKLATSDLAALPRKSVEVKLHDGSMAKFEGVVLADVLQLAGVKFGESIRGARLATYLLVEAADGYRVVFALPELDPAFSDKQVILADHRDGKVMTAPEGPLRLVVPDEKRQARWVRQVTALKIIRAPDGMTKETTKY